LEEKMKTRYWFVLFVCLCLLSVTACNPSASVSVPTPTALSALAPSPKPPIATSAPLPTVAPTSPPAPTAAPALESSGLPAEPQAIKFQTADGKTTLDGLFYPSALKTAPVIVLVHWVGGDQSDWNEIAFWLQNRGLSGTSKNVKRETWLDPTWFPALPKGVSLNVFTFTFRGCENGCREFNPKGWLADAYAAMTQAAKLPGIDPKRIVAAGASIGADGALDGCAWLNETSNGPGGKCLGAFSFSPGSYLNLAYAETVRDLQIEQPAKPVWCLSAENDREASPACKSAKGEAYRAISFPGNAHGMDLIDPKIEPNTLGLLLDWLKLSLGL
jgi:dienelactone hydrolase